MPYKSEIVCSRIAPCQEDWKKLLKTFLWLICISVVILEYLPHIYEVIDCWNGKDIRSTDLRLCQSFHVWVIQEQFWYSADWKLERKKNKHRFAKFCLRYRDLDKSFYKSFFDKGPGIIERIQLLGKNSETVEAGVLKCFSTESWEKLSIEKKEKHSFYDCNESLRNNKFKKHFEQIPARNKHRKRKAFYKNF